MPKKPKLTPEEKKLLKVEKKAEKKRQQILKKKQIKHGHLSRELKYGALTVERHEKNWKKMLVSITVPKMREDLTYAWHNFERIIDSKDFTISLLMDDINNAEEQYMMNLRCHAENIDTLIFKFKDRLDELKCDYDTELAAMEAATEKETADIKLSHAEGEEYLKTMLYGLEMARKEQEKTVRGDYLSKIDEEMTKYSDIIQSLRSGLEHQFSGLWNNTVDFLKDYNIQTAERRKGYLQVNQQDVAMQKLIKDQLLALHKSTVYIKKLRKRFSESQRTQGVKISDLLHERAFFANAFWTLKNRLQDDRNLDQENLTLVTVEGNISMKHLETIKKKGERMLGLAAVCRKLETQKEKILPFPLVAREMGVVVSSIDEFSADNINGEDLKNFWQRIGEANSTRYAINEEREYLKRENEWLKMQIHKYCECLDCPALPPIRNRRKGEQINIIDGNLAMKCYSKQCS